MSQRKIYFATNRNPIPNAETASDFGTAFANPPSDLRFGKVTRSDAAESMVVFDQKLISKIPDPNFDDPSKTAEVLGSTQMFREINAELRSGKDLILYIHGYNNDPSVAPSTKPSRSPNITQPTPQCSCCFLGPRTDRQRSAPISATATTPKPRVPH
jgi:esterase/lipase superfamily enzyme